jgi:cobalt/nickel transport system ATP-binding protein
MADGLTADIFNDDLLLRKSHLERPLRMQACPICSQR